MDHLDLHLKFFGNRLRVDVSSGAVAVAGYFYG